MIGVLTYDHPHRKTQDLLMRMKATGHDIHVFAHTWAERDNFKPLIKHRPDEFIGISVEKMCENLGYRFEKCNHDKIDADKGQLFLIAGAGVINEKMVEKYEIINSHPGILPISRGLDAYKWAVYNGDPIGVTLYYVGHEVDTGLLIKSEIINVDFCDTFHGVARKIYDLEINMLANFKELIKNAPKTVLYADGTPTRRMPHRLEMKLFDRFDKLRKAQ